MAEETPRTDSSKTQPPGAPLPPRASVALELGKIIIPVVGTIIAACLSGIFLLLNNANFFAPKQPTAAPTAPLVVVAAPPPPPPAPPPPQPPAATSSPQPTLTPLPPTPTALTWKVRYQDDFSDPISGWPVMKADPDVTKEYADGGYLITMTKDNINTFTRNASAEVLEDVRVEVDALQIGEKTPWDIGLACRIDGTSVYELSAYESNGVKKYGIYRWSNEAYQTLAEKVIVDARIFREGKIANQLRADCVGDHFTLWVNGEKVLEATDPNPLPRGKTGIVTGYSSGVQVFYDNFAIYTP
jgi:hypothetical protein